MASIKSVDESPNFTIFLELNSIGRDRITFPDPTSFCASLSNYSTTSPISPIIPFVYMENALFKVDSFPYFHQVLRDLVFSYNLSIENSLVGLSALVMDNENNVFQTSVVKSSVDAYSNQNFIPNQNNLTVEINHNDQELFSNSKTYQCFFRLKKYNGPKIEISGVESDGRVIQLSGDASTTDGAYNGFYIWGGQTVKPHLFSSKIISYNGTTKKAILQDNGFDGFVGSYCEVSNEISFSDNSLRTGGLLNVAEDYIVRLISLSIPSAPVVGQNGNKLLSYPYLQVHLGNSFGCNTNNTIVTNNKIKGKFIVPIDDTNPAISSSFYRLKDCFIDVPMRLNLFEPLYFSIFLPNGQPLILYQVATTQYDIPDSQLIGIPQNPPSDLNQVIAIFRLIRISARKQF